MISIYLLLDFSLSDAFHINNKCILRIKMYICRINA